MYGMYTCVFQCVRIGQTMKLGEQVLHRSNVCAHVCACMHRVCMHASCVHACMHVCVHACMRVCMCACVHACMHACVCACMRVCVGGGVPLSCSLSMMTVQV